MYSEPQVKKKSSLFFKAQRTSKGMKGIDPEPHWPIVNTYSLHTKPV
jgi:hypothetical protein